jgi:hypothetical protein
LAETVVQGGDNNVQMQDEMGQNVVVQQAHESMVLNPPDASNSSMNMMLHGNAAMGLQGQDQFIMNLQVGVMQFGPELPPDML